MNDDSNVFLHTCACMAVFFHSLVCMCRLLLLLLLLSLSLSIWILSPTNCSFLENKSTQLFFKFEFLNMILSSRIILFFILLFKDVFFFFGLKWKEGLRLVNGPGLGWGIFFFNFFFISFNGSNLKIRLGLGWALARNCQEESIKILYKTKIEVCKKLIESTKLI